MKNVLDNAKLRKPCFSSGCKGTIIFFILRPLTVILFGFGMKKYLSAVLSIIFLLYDERFSKDIVMSEGFGPMSIIICLIDSGWKPLRLNACNVASFGSSHPVNFLRAMPSRIWLLLSTISDIDKRPSVTTTGYVHPKCW